MSGMRLIDAHGVLRGVQIPESLLDDILDNEPFLELFYRYIKGSYRMIQPESDPG
jgi:hypothetical protein